LGDLAYREVAFNGRFEDADSREKRNGPDLVRKTQPGMSAYFFFFFATFFFFFVAIKNPPLFLAS
jgi:hypothetical protein